VKRLRIRLPRLRRPSKTKLENTAVATGFFGGIATCAAAVALIYLPAGLFLAGASAAALAALYARATPDRGDGA
jgi:hypothetical protein